MRAYAQLPQSVRDAHQLVIAFRVGILRRLEHRAFAQTLGIRPRDLVLTGFVSDEQLAALYRSCGLFIFPSLYEGAGLPILEAMSCGAPVAASRTTSIPELLGDLEATFDPADPVDMARCLRAVLESPEQLEGLRERSRRRVQIYTWERVAKRTLEGYERAEEIPLRTPSGRNGSPGRRRRLAVVTPWPPQDSGAAAYSRRLVAELAEHAEVEVIVSADENGLGFDRSLESSVKLHTDAEFDWLRGVRSYDRCLFVLGDSRFHVHAFEQMMRVPGVVLTHDARLLGLYRELHRYRHLYDPHWLEDKLAELYGDRIPLGDLRLIPYEEPDEDGRIGMTGEMQSNAERVLVQSRHQAELLRLDRPPGAAPIEVVPFAIPSIELADGRTPNDPLVIATGTREPSSELDAAIEGLRAAHPGVRLELLPEEAMHEPATLPRADLAVCLQSDADQGRPSSAVATLIAARVPTIVADVGWAGELPDRVVLRVPADFDAGILVERMRSALDEGERRVIQEAQDAFAEANSFARVAERYAELLSL